MALDPTQYIGNILSGLKSSFGDLPLPGTLAPMNDQAVLQYQQALQQTAEQQAQLAQSYGYNVNPNTGAINSINAANPYSQVMSMLQQHADSLGQLRNQLAGSGLGSTGLAAQRMNLLHFLDQGDTANLSNNFLQGWNGLGEGNANAETQFVNQINNNAQNAVSYALQNQLFNIIKAPAPQTTNPGAPTNPGGVGPGSGAVANPGNIISGGLPAGTPQVKNMLGNNPAGSNGNESSIGAHLGLPTGILAPLKPNTSIATGSTARGGPSQVYQGVHGF